MRARLFVLTTVLAALPLSAHANHFIYGTSNEYGGVRGRESLPPQGASAAPAEVEGSYTLVHRVTGSGSIGVLRCGARTYTQRNLHIVLTTTVTCAIVHPDETLEDTLSSVGPTVEIAVSDALEGPFDVCVTSSAWLLNPLTGAQYAVNDSHCSSITDL